MKNGGTTGKLTETIIGVAISIHRELGPGLLEKVYETILEKKLLQLGYRVERQKPISLQYEDLFFPEVFFADLIVENTVILELKSIETFSKSHKKQLITYLRLTGLPVGLLINFNEAILHHGIVRVVNNYKEDEGELSF